MKQIRFSNLKKTIISASFLQKWLKNEGPTIITNKYRRQGCDEKLFVIMSVEDYERLIAGYTLDKICGE